MNLIQEYENIVLEVKDKVAYIFLNKPEKGNSICGSTIGDLSDAFQLIDKSDKIRCVVISSKNDFFCKGADINWLKNILNMSKRENSEMSLLVGKLLFMIYSFPKPVICKINGYVSGCGLGLVSVCDIVIAPDDIEMVFDELKYGFTPSIYAPYVIKKIGENKAKELFITGIPFTANEAKTFGFVNFVCKREELDKTTENVINHILSCSPNSIKDIKDVISHIRIMRYDEVLKFTSESFSEVTSSDELKEGINSILENRKPNWV